MNDELHQVDGKFYKECEVIMLPTDVSKRASCTKKQSLNVLKN